MEPIRVSATVLEEMTAAIFTKLGFSLFSSQTIAQSLVSADSRGVHSHGVMLVPIYVDRIQRGLVERNDYGEVTVDRDAVAVIDGRHGMGQVLGRQAMHLAIEKANSHGVGSVGVYNSHHFGAGAFYVLMAVEKECIGIAASNSTPLMPAPGGAQGLVGTTAFAIGVPAGREKPLVLDMALSQVAQGKIRYAARSGQLIPSNYATDDRGIPTTDPETALKGFLLPMGGPKGFGLALMVDVLAGILLGGAWGPKVRSVFRDLENRQACGHFFLAFHIKHFGASATFDSEIEEMIQYVHSSRLAPGIERVFVPGEIEWNNAASCSKDGIPLNSQTLVDFAQTAKRLGISVDGLHLKSGKMG